MDPDRRGLTPHRRQHWAVEPDPEPDPILDVTQTPEETRVEAKRLLWRDSAIILVGVVVALLVFQLLPRSNPGLAVDESASSSGGGAVASLPPGSSGVPGATLGPIIDPGLGIDATQAPPARTLPPTGSFEPGETAAPTPRSSRKPPATIAPAPSTPARTPRPTRPPDPTPEPPPTNPPTDPPATLDLPSLLPTFPI
jgi:hypothetical protein